MTKRLLMTLKRDPLLRIKSSRKNAAICWTARERAVLRLRQAELVLREIGDAERVCQSYVCQLLQRIRARLGRKPRALTPSRSPRGL
jgi:hypothetical protein